MVYSLKEPNDLNKLIEAYSEIQA